MKNKKINLILFMLCFMIAFAFSVSFAEGDEEVIAKVSNSILSALLWVAYIIAIGVLLMSAIKYMMSGANEKANLKGILPKYLIGVAAITCCFLIAQTVAQMAGNDTAEEIVGAASGFGIEFVGGDS